MQRFLSITILSVLALCCVPPKQVSQNTTAPNNKKIANKTVQSQQIAPGTCSLIVKDHKVEKEATKLWLTGKVKLVKAYGAGFTETLVKDQEIKIRITNKQANSLNKPEEIDCIIASVSAMNKPVFFELIEHQ